MNIEINLTWITLILLTGIGLFLVHNLQGLKIFGNHDRSFAKQFLDKYPLVLPEFLQKTHKEQTVENNQEIHELNQRIEHLERYTQELNNKIDEKLNILLEELKKHG